MELHEASKSQEHPAPLPPSQHPVSSLTPLTLDIPELCELLTNWSYVNVNLAMSKAEISLEFLSCLCLRFARSQVMPSRYVRSVPISKEQG